MSRLKTIAAKAVLFPLAVGAWLVFCLIRSLANE